MFKEVYMLLSSEGNYKVIVIFEFLVIWGRIEGI